MTTVVIIAFVLMIIFYFTKKKTNPVQEQFTSEKEKLITVESKKLSEYKTEISLNLNENELKRRLKNREFSSKKIEPDNFDIAGFYGRSKSSKNKKYQVVFSDGYEENNKWKKGKVALIENKEICFKINFDRPNDCKVSNNGIVIICDWLNTEELKGVFIALDKSGKKIIREQISANLGNSEISDDGRFAIVETYSSQTGDSNKIIVFDLQNKKVIQKFDRQFAFTKAKIDSKKETIRFTNNSKISFEIDLNGNQVNEKEYEELVFGKGSLLDKIFYLEEKQNEEVLRNEKYLSLLMSATKDEDCCYSYGKDRLLRRIGEFHEANNNESEAIEYWELAIKENPKVGIKRKLDKLKKRTTPNKG